MGGCHVLVAGFWRRKGVIAHTGFLCLWASWQHCEETLSVDLLLSSNSENFFQGITSPPACCREDSRASHPEACLGAGFTLSQNLLRKISAKPSLKRLLLWELEQVFQIRLHTKYALEYIFSVTLCDLRLILRHI